MADVRRQLGGGELHVHQGRAAAELKQEEVASDRGVEAQKQEEPSASFSKPPHGDNYKVLGEPL